mmetsp:Transcript_26873/g.50179  ORF Transcript_26873/g.50179 Transcript_26873/m.50179 type:complete len:357 (+) Transcript_26873:220-1290(+)
MMPVLLAYGAMHMPSASRRSSLVVVIIISNLDLLGIIGGWLQFLHRLGIVTRLVFLFVVIVIVIVIVADVNLLRIGLGPITLVGSTRRRSTRTRPRILAFRQFPAVEILAYHVAYTDLAQQMAGLWVRHERRGRPGLGVGFFVPHGGRGREVLGDHVRVRVAGARGEEGVDMLELVLRRPEVKAPPAVPQGRRHLQMRALGAQEMVRGLHDRQPLPVILQHLRRGLSSLRVVLRLNVDNLQEVVVRQALAQGEEPSDALAFVADDCRKLDVQVGREPVTRAQHLEQFFVSWVPEAACGDLVRQESFPAQQLPRVPVVVDPAWPVVRHEDVDRRRHLKKSENVHLPHVVGAALRVSI